MPPLKRGNKGNSKKANERATARKTANRRLSQARASQTSRGRGGPNGTGSDTGDAGASPWWVSSGSPDAGLRDDESNDDDDHYALIMTTTTTTTAMLTTTTMRLTALQAVAWTPQAFRTGRWMPQASRKGGPGRVAYGTTRPGSGSGPVRIPGIRRRSFDSLAVCGYKKRSLQRRVFAIIMPKRVSI